MRSPSADSRAALAGARTSGCAIRVFEHPPSRTSGAAFHDDRLRGESGRGDRRNAPEDPCRWHSDYLPARTRRDAACGLRRSQHAQREQHQGRVRCGRCDQLQCARASARTLTASVPAPAAIDQPVDDAHPIGRPCEHACRRPAQGASTRLLSLVRHRGLLGCACATRPASDPWIGPVALRPRVSPGVP